MPITLESAAELVAQLEGPYKWYAIAAVLFVLTGLVTQFVFKTFKWFILLLIVGGFILGLFWGLAQLAGVA